MGDGLVTNLCGVALRNPVILAAGTCGTLDEFSDVLDLSRVGALVSKSITREPREGNAAWRILPARGGGGGAGMLNAIGLANPGVDAFVRDYLPRAAAVPCPVIVSVAGFSVEDYVAVAAALEASRTPSVSGGPHGAGRAGAGGASGGAGMREPNGPSLTLGVRGVSAVELNVSCPNVKAGCEFVSSPAALKEVVGEVRRVLASLPLLVKLSPLVTDITAVARAAVDAGADALTVSNTIPAMEIDVDTRRPVLANRTGGLSGPGLHPVAVRLVHECWRKVCRDARGPGKHVPIIGAGGVMNWRDAAEFILAGATAVQMGTALFADPRSPLRVVRGLERWVREQGCGSVGELVGAVKD